MSISIDATPSTEYLYIRGEVAFNTFRALSLIVTSQNVEIILLERKTLVIDTSS